ncbi:hypothetical protein JTB14_011766 [Gonioctena quinquepunctata]|nr:hypothetical protein JTB14_011766 [Gonioctena quinquepunctata]
MSKNTYIGEAEITNEDESSSFVGRSLQNKKIWLFISRVKDHVNKKMIEDYLKSKTNTAVDVAEIDTYHKMKDNKCFKIGMDYNMKETAYTNTFWPRGVAVHRFNFKKEEKYLERIQDNTGENSHFQKSTEATKIADSSKPQQKTIYDEDSIGQGRIESNHLMSTNMNSQLLHLGISTTKNHVKTIESITILHVNIQGISNKGD